MSNNQSIAIIGGGLVGLAISYKLLLKNPNLKITLYEKEDEVSKHQSGRNSGVLHCGLYYQPGSLKAKLAVEGIRQMTEFCRTHEIAHEICGKVVVASDEVESGYLDNLAKRGEANGLKGLKKLTNAELKEREPYVRAHSSLLVPEEGIADFKAVARKLKELILQMGAKINLSSEVKEITNASSEVIVKSQAGGNSYDYIVSCTGVYTDRIYKQATGKKPPIKIVPFRGEYYMLNKEAHSLLNHLVYPVPNPKFPFLGVHFTKLVNGEKEVGPNAVLAFKREGYKKTDFSLYDTYESLSYVGLRKFLFKNLSFSIGELETSLFKSKFLAKAKKIIPEIEYHHLGKGTAGVRAQAMREEGTLDMDFVMEREGRQVHVLNAPSPGATSSLAIAEYVVENYLVDL
jgi:L-2-hydroxyglutarate oxidase